MKLYSLIHSSPSLTSSAGSAGPSSPMDCLCCSLLGNPGTSSCSGTSPRVGGFHWDEKRRGRFRVSPGSQTLCDWLRAAAPTGLELIELAAAHSHSGIRWLLCVCVLQGMKVKVTNTLSQGFYLFLCCGDIKLSTVTLLTSEDKDQKSSSHESLKFNAAV